MREKECERESDLAGALKSFGSLNEPLTRIPESGPVRFQYQKWKWKWIWMAAETARLPAMPRTPSPPPALLTQFVNWAAIFGQVVEAFPRCLSLRSPALPCPVLPACCLGHRRLVIAFAARLSNPPHASPCCSYKIYMSMMPSLQRRCLCLFLSFGTHIKFVCGFVQRNMSLPEPGRKQRTGRCRAGGGQYDDHA